MTANLATGIIHQQRPDQYTQRMFLPHRPRILRPAPLTDSPLIAYPDTLCIIPTRMRPDFLYGTGCFYIPVLADIKMISGSVHSTPAVAHLQILFGKVPVRLCGGTVDNNQINHPSSPYARADSYYTRNSRSYCNHHFQNSAPNRFTFHPTVFLKLNTCPPST